MERNKLKKKYILLTSAGFPEGNAASVYINQFLKGLIYNKREVIVHLLSSGNNINNITEYGVKYNYLSRRLSNHAAINKALSIIKNFFNSIVLLFSLRHEREKIVLLIYNNKLLYNIPIYLGSFFFKIKLVSFVPEYYDKPKFKEGIIKVLNWYGFIINLFYLNRLSDKLIVFSSFLKKMYIKKGYDASKIYIQPNLTDFDDWLTDKVNLKYDLGYSGSAVAKDGLIFLFKAIKLLKERNVIITILIVGDLPYGKSVLPDLKKTCKNLGIYDQVKFTGMVPHSEVKKYINQCRILVLSRIFSRKTQAGFPTKLGEYFACKKIVLSTNFGDVKKYFTDGKDIILVKKIDPNEITEKIEWIINNPQKAESIKENGYNVSKKIFDYKSSVLKICTYLEG